MAKIELPEVLPAWLPHKCDVRGPYEEVRDALYQIFCRDFKNGDPAFQSKALTWNTTPDTRENYEKGFFHLIKRESELAERRALDDYRAERLPWCRPTIENHTRVEVTYWKHFNKGRVRDYFWLQDFDYAVVLEERTNVYFLVTGYHVDGPSTRRSLSKKYEQRIR